MPLSDKLGLGKVSKGELRVDQTLTIGDRAYKSLLIGKCIVLLTTTVNSPRRRVPVLYDRILHPIIRAPIPGVRHGLHFQRNRNGPARTSLSLQSSS